MRIIFMGTPDFAVASLHALHQAGHEIVGVVTAPDKPSGRGLNLLPSAVKKFALEQKLKLWQPERLKDPIFLSDLRDARAELIVVVAFRMLPADIWQMTPTINLHASLLPLYRGAAPINWAIINGETKTGLTTFYINELIDEGDLLMQSEISIGSSECFGELYDRMKMAGGNLLLETIDGIISGTLKGQKQESKGIEPHRLMAPKLNREVCQIDWNQSAEAICNRIRGLSPYPAARTIIHKGESEPLQLKIYEAKPCNEFSSSEPGQILSDGRTFIKVVCGDKSVELTNIQLQGKKILRTDEFLRGYKGIADSYME